MFRVAREMPRPLVPCRSAVLRGPLARPRAGSLAVKVQQVGGVTGDVPHVRLAAPAPVRSRVRAIPGVDVHRLTLLERERPERVGVAGPAPKPLPFNCRDVLEVLNSCTHSAVCDVLDRVSLPGESKYTR